MSIKSALNNVKNTFDNIKDSFITKEQNSKITIKSPNEELEKIGYINNIQKIDEDNKSIENEDILNNDLMQKLLRDAEKHAEKEKQEELEKDVFEELKEKVEEKIGKYNPINIFFEGDKNENFKYYKSYYLRQILNTIINEMSLIEQYSFASALLIEIIDKLNYIPDKLNIVYDINTALKKKLKNKTIDIITNTYSFTSYESEKFREWLKQKEKQIYNI